MVPVTPQTLIVPQTGGPCVLVLVPTEDYGQQKNVRVVPVWMGMAEAAALRFVLEGYHLQRPLTHTLFLETIHSLGAVVDRAEIVDVRGHTFFVQLILRTADRIITLDARPSDAIALALLQDAPIYMADNVLDAASYPFLFGSSAQDEEELEQFKEFVQSLTPDDFSDTSPSAPS